MRPRNDYVLIRRVNLGQTPTGIAVSDASVEGVEHHIVAWGSEVKDLKEGDKVLIVGQNKQDYGFIPNSMDLLITRQQNIVLVY